jgi:hypothetical protein
LLIPSPLYRLENTLSKAVQKCLLDICVASFHYGNCFLNPQFEEQFDEPLSPNKPHFGKGCFELKDQRS